MVNINGEFKNKVSIIIPIRHGEDIYHVLQSIGNSFYNNYEVIIVDEGLERSAQRNIGIARARGQFLLILDSDQRISETLLLECVYSMKLVDALYIPEQIMTKGWFGRLRNWERQFYNQTPVDCVRFVKRKDCPLFDVNLNGPEDADFDRRIKGIKGITHAKIYHYDNIGILDFFRKKAYYSKSMTLFAKKHPKDKVLNFWWRCFAVFFEQGKWKRVIRRPDLMLLTWCLILVRGIIYLCIK
jgi:glycosyltransferase involved in cell wall biosynthesis